MKKREFPASYPLLGLLAEGPCSGYDLCQRGKQTIGPFWHEGFAQIYASLAIFEERGLASVVHADPGGRSRKVYAITPEGDRAFVDWLHRPVESPDLRRHELLVKVFFGRRIAPAVLSRHLAAYESGHRQWVEGLEALAHRLTADQPEDPNLPYWLATLDHGACLGRALTAWGSKARHDLCDRGVEQS